MTIHKQKRAGVAENSALSDLAFLLIIYFIVIAGFNVNKGFLMNLPAKDSVRIIFKDDLMRFELNNAGNLSFEKEELSFQDAENQIKAAIAMQPNLAVLLWVEPQTKWQNVVRFVELAQKLEVNSFSFKLAGGL
jgi:biopolymer transport protein ExbD